MDNAQRQRQRERERYITPSQPRRLRCGSHHLVRLAVILTCTCLHITDTHIATFPGETPSIPRNAYPLCAELSSSHARTHTHRAPLPQASSSLPPPLSHLPTHTCGCTGSHTLSPSPSRSSSHTQTLFRSSLHAKLHTHSLPRVGQAAWPRLNTLTWSLFMSLLTHRLVFVCVDAYSCIFNDLPGDVLAAPESALCGWISVAQDGRFRASGRPGHVLTR